MSANQQKTKVAEDSAPDTPEAAELPVVVPGAPQPIVISQQPATPETVRLECLRIALGRGLSLRTADSRQALRQAVDDYHAIVADKPFPKRDTADG